MLHLPDSPQFLLSSSTPISGILLFFYSGSSPFFSSPTPSTQCPIPFLPHSPSVPSTFFYSPFKRPTQTSIFFSTLMSGWLVLIVGLVEWIFVVVLWFFLCCGVVVFLFMGFLLPHSPSVPSTFFYPSLKITYPAQSFGAGISENA